MASIRERTSKGSGSTWAVLYRHGSKQSSRTFTDQKSALRFKGLVELLGPDRAWAELMGGEQDARITVDEMAPQFLLWKGRDITPRTAADYQRDYDNWIKPWFGHRVAETVDEGDVQKWVDHMARTLSPKSVADRHMLLHSIYKYGKARSRRLVTHNPCEETELPKRSKGAIKGTEISEWRAIRRAAEVKNPDAADLILFLGSIGWRWSEAAALAVRDVEDDGERVWVTVTRVFRMVDNRQVLAEGKAKSSAGLRRCELPSKAAAMVRRRVVGKAPNDFVFTNSRGSHWNQNTFLRNTWPSLLRAAKVGSPERRPTPHWLRHMAVAAMAKAGIPMHEIQRIIGHEDLSTTNNTYGSMISTLSRRSLTNLDAVLEDESPEWGEMVRGQVVTGELSEPLTHASQPRHSLPGSIELSAAPGT